MVCAECGKTFPSPMMVTISHHQICAGCKPMFLQRLAEGAPLLREGHGSLFRSKRDLVVRQNSPLPDTCIRCNAAANGFKLRRTLSWHSRWYYLLIIPGLLVYAIVAVLVRKKAVVDIGLCEVHQKKRKTIIWACWAGVLAGFSTLFLSPLDSVLPVFGILVVIFAMVFGILKSRMIHATKIDPDFVWIRGACPDYLMHLPEWSDVQ